MENLKLFIDYSPIPIIILNMNGQIMAFNHHAQLPLHIKAGKYISDMVNDSQQKKAVGQMYQALQQSNEIHQRLILGSYCFHIDATKFQYNQQQYFFIIFRDITSDYRKEQQVYQLATRDMLTGLYNRYYCEKHVNKHMQLLKPSQLGMLVLIDIDDFKQVNDRYGHLIGDAYLEHVGSILNSLNYGKNIVARLGGVEFALYFHHIECKDAVWNLIERLQCLLDVNRFQKNDISISLQFTIGYAIGGQPANFITLYKEADEQLRASKQLKFKTDSMQNEIN